MRLTIILVLAISSLVQPLAMAQQVGPNINVLPLVLPEYDQNNVLTNPDWYLEGDGYLQRQVEPSIAVSTRNPDHVITFFNDYRAIDIVEDEAPPDPFPVVTIVLAALNLNPPTMMLASLLGDVLPLLEPPTAAAEAWVGMSRSYDGGLTWLGGMLPGGPFDHTPPSQLSPVNGRQAATDPVAGAAPCGYVYVVFVAFTRGDESSLAVARYRDFNNDESGDTWVYEGTWVIETGNNATNGYFLDKPFLAVDHDRTGADACGSTIYVSYTTFNGLDKDGKFQSKVNVAYSTDNAETWDKIKVNKTLGQGQGTAIAIDPRPDTPSDPDGGGTVYVAFRHFFNPDGIFVTKTTNFGKKFSAPVEITEGIPMSTFDQPTISNTLDNPTTETAFRSNAFPTLAVTGNGTVFAAWQEKVDIASSDPNFLGLPDPNGSPRIVMTRSADEGATWSERRAVDFGDRDGDDSGGPCVFFDSTPEPGFGALPQCRPSGPQVKPRLVSGGGQFLLGYTESRGLLGTDLNGNEALNEADLSPSGFASGYHRAFDFRAALLNPTTGELESTTQISRYPISLTADLADGEHVADIAPINPPCSPDYLAIDPDGGPYPPCVRQLNLANRPQSGAGTSPFMGDYPDATSILPFVPDGNGGWRWATEPGDVPYRGFRVVFPDNRHLLPPTEPDGLPEIDRYPYYSEPETGQPSCINTGSRNTDVLTARVDTDLVLTTPTTYKQLDARRSFPFTINNRTDITRFYRLTIIDPEDLATFSPKPGVYIDEGDLEVFRFSSVAQVIYVEPGPDPLRAIRVNVEEIDAIDGLVIAPEDGGQSGTIVFNADPGNPDVATPQQEVQNPFAENPFYENPFYENPFYENPFFENPFYENPFYENPFYENSALDDVPIYNVIDTTWTVTAGSSNTAASYLALVNIDNAAQFVDNYAFQLVIFKDPGFAAANSCELFPQAEPVVLSNVVYNPAENPFYENPFFENPFYENPFYENPFFENPFYENSTFALAPSDAGLKAATKSSAGGDGTLKANRGPDRVNILFRAFQLVPDGALGDFVYNPDPEEGGDSPALTVIYRGCDTRDPDATCYFSTAPDLFPRLNVVNTPADDPIYSPAIYSVEAAANSTLTGFPDTGWKLFNESLPNQEFGDAIAENGFLQHGFHVCPTDHIDRPQPPEEWRWATEPLDLNECDPVQGTLPDVDCETTPDPRCTSLGLGEFEGFDAIDLGIPNLDPGDYYIVLYADQDLEVSERIEVNNWVAVPLTITNPPPVVTDLSFEVNEDHTLTGSLTATDPNGDDIDFAIVVDPSFGSITAFDPHSGDFTYQPNANFNGEDTFDFVATDGNSDSEIATAWITVFRVNDAPTAWNEEFSIDENAPFSAALPADDVDLDDTPNPDVLTFSIPIHPINGSVEIAGDVFTYTPNPAFIGTDSFTFGVSDLAGETATGVITIHVLDSTPDWSFIGLATPWRPGYWINGGSAVPLKWYYTDPANGSLVDSSMAEPVIRITGYVPCGSGGNPLQWVHDPGSSDLRFVDGYWQFNWDTVGLDEGCYFISIYHPYTNQINADSDQGDPLMIELR